MQDMEFQSTEYGKIQIADEVIQVIAGLAATEVAGVLDMTGSIAGGITESLLGRKNLSKGVRVRFADDDRSCSIDLSVVLEFGVNIPETGAAIQEHVKEAVEGMTGLDVASVNVSVAAVVLPGDKERVRELSEPDRRNRA
ncbi:MAG: Asp23/Gls24 family envelope stress response protein [Alicyclobacillus herbarius]|uniref:Asp23/Gls24 family envelope stress response protein n=1 Tax=Alicyclobacillus herbarius TaxID=122960 RepID=UPI0004067E18|nr:Asp23/Gls24 family envelope stress response protein [Alicyclobacillus herbarius]MCL6631654.1 Asp23/Gls24 family envelope stress response protein [Alicyclobacillus herbarius]